MTEAPAPEVGSDAATRRWVGLAAVGLALVVAVCGGLLIGSRMTGSHPSNDSVDAGFARDMQIHHTQAVQMSYAVSIATQDREVRQIAYDIMTSQQAQIGRMSGWLDAWELPAYSSAPLMAWMSGSGGPGGHDMAGGSGDDEAFVATDGALMPGMATDTEMERLRESTGRDAEILYLQLMIDHHRGGVEMARYAANHAEDDEVRRVADRMATSQAVEIDAMNDMLVERGADPV
jgi:uncharacterized protein (DUF305 family)